MNWGIVARLKKRYPVTFSSDDKSPQRPTADGTISKGRLRMSLTPWPNESSIYCRLGVSTINSEHLVWSSFIMVRLALNLSLNLLSNKIHIIWIKDWNFNYFPFIRGLQSKAYGGNISSYVVFNDCPCLGSCFSDSLICRVQLFLPSWEIIGVLSW